MNEEGTGMYFNCCSIFYSHSRVFNTEFSPFPEVSVNQTIYCSRVVLSLLLLVRDATSGHLVRVDVI